MRPGGLTMYRITTTVTTLAVALLLSAVVSTGTFAVAAGSDSASTEATAVAASTTTTFEATRLESSSDATPLPQPSGPAPSESSESSESSGTGDTTASDERAPAPAASVEAATTSTPAARPQPTTPASPLAAQPAPFGSTSPAPSAPACAKAITGTTAGAPSRTSPLGVAGTTSEDLQSFATAYNAIRVANCLAPVPFANIRYDSCMEDRLFWMAEDPSLDPMSAWGHIGSKRSDGVPSVGCDGNLAGGVDNDGAIVAQKWWNSSGHRTSLYKPTFTGNVARVCILFAMTHGGVPDEPYSFTRSAARWVDC